MGMRLRIHDLGYLLQQLLNKMENENLKPGDIVPCQIDYGVAFSIKVDGILIERYKNGWIVELEDGENKLKRAYSPDYDNGLDYRILGQPE